MVEDKLIDIQIDYNQVCNVAPEFKVHTLEEYKWARMCACSRIFGIEINGKKTDAFVPYADMLNHKHP